MASSYSRNYSTTTSIGGSTSHTTSTSKTAATGQVSDTTQKNYDKYNTDYKESSRVSNAYNKLQETLNNKPGEFSSSYQTQLDNIYDKITNGEKFSFDVNDSVMYQQMKDQYSALGKLAMKDTMGQAASMTGGYASSYSQTAGQQAYQNYLQELNEQLPSIYSMELEKYQTDREDLYNQYDVTKGLYDTEYDQYRDSVADWQSDRSYYQSAYQDERDYDYDKWSNDRSYWNSEYWNEKNSETTTTSESTTNTSNWNTSTTSGYSTSYSTGTSGSTSGTSGSTKKTTGSTWAPLSQSTINSIKNGINSQTSRSGQTSYRNAAAQTSYGNLNAITDYMNSVKGIGTSNKLNLTRYLYGNK